MPFGISGSKSSSQSSSSQDVFSADLFRQLFGDASNVAGNIDTSTKNPIPVLASNT